MKPVIIVWKTIKVKDKAHPACTSLEMTPCGKLTLEMIPENNRSVTCLLVISIIHNLSWVTHDKVGYVDPPAVFKDALRKQPPHHLTSQGSRGSTCVHLRFPNFGSEGVGVMSGIYNSSRLGEGTGHTAPATGQTWIVQRSSSPVVKCRR